MGKLIKVQKLKKPKGNEEIPYKKLKNEKESQLKLKNEKVKDKKHKKSHVLKLSKPTTGGIRKKILSKVEKKRQKSEKLKRNINKTLAAFEEDKAKKIREKRPIIGDLKPLLDSLPSLDELISIRDSSNKTGIASIDRHIQKSPKNRKERKAQLVNEKTETFLDRFDSVQKIWRNPEFQKDPRKLISEQIRKRRLVNSNEMEN